MTDTLDLDTLVDARLDLEALVDARLAALGLVAPATPRAAVNPDGTPGHVAAGELIESAWGNATSDSITTLKSRLDLTELRSGGGSYTSDAGGFLVVSYGATFLSTPITIPTVVDPTGAKDYFVTVYDRQPAYFVLRVFNASGSAVGSTGVTVHWIAMRLPHL